MDSIQLPIKKSRGFTLVEAMAVIAIVAILVAMVAPSFNDQRDRARVRQAAEDIYGLFILAKAEMPLRNQNTSINIATDTNWCVGYKVEATSACDCTNTTSCTVLVGETPVLQRVNYTDHPEVSITENFRSTGTTFQAPRGAASAAGKVVVTSGNWSAQVIVSSPGRIRLCNTTENSLVGYKSCT